MIQFAPQVINLLATLILLLSFAMISQRRIVSLINLFTMQGLALVVTSFLLGYITNQHELYVSGALTLVLKVILIPWMLHRMIRKLNVRWDIETLLNVPTTMLVGIGLVIFSFSLALPVSRLSSSLAGGSLGIALSCVMLSFLMLITRSKAVPQVIGFLSMENGLIFAATAVTSGMPMIVEFGIALDVLVGVLILGVFMFQIREKFDTLDIHHLEKLKED